MRPSKRLCYVNFAKMWCTIYIVVASCLCCLDTLDIHDTDCVRKVRSGALPQRCHCFIEYFIFVKLMKKFNFGIQRQLTGGLNPFGT